MFLSFVPLAAAGEDVEIRKLNGPLARVITGDVSEPQLSPDGRWAVYLADLEVDDILELYAVPSDGSAPAVRLSDDHGRDALQSFQISPDSTRVVYHVERNLDELRSVPIDGSAPPAQLNTQALAVIDRYSLSSDGTRVAFLAAVSLGSSPLEVYAAPADGSAPSVKLNPPLPSFAFVLDFALSPDGAQVVYASNHEVIGARELFVVPSTGGASTKLSGPLVPTANVMDFAVSPDGARVVYRADQRSDELHELFSVPLDASAAPLPLHTPAEDVSAVYLFAAHGRLLFTVGLTLYSVPADASAPAAVVGRFYDRFELSTDGERVVFPALTGPVRLDSRPVDLSAPAVALVSGFAPSQFQVYRDHVLYIGPGLSGLQCVPITGGAPVRLDLAGSSNFVDAFALEREEERVVFTEYQRLYSASLLHPEDGVELAAGVIPDTRLLFTRRPAPGHARSFPPGRELGSAVVFMGLQGDVHDLYRAPLDGSAAPLQLNSPFTLTQPVGYVHEFLVRGPWVVYRADEDEAYVEQLFAARLDGSGPATELAGPQFPQFAALSSGVIAPVAARFLYLAGPSAELFSVPLDGSPPVQLSQTDGGGVRQFGLDAAEARVVLLQEVVGAANTELYVVPVDGSAPALRLSQPGVQVYDFQLTPDGTRAVYRVNSYESDLFSVRLDGSASPVKLNGLVAQSLPGVLSYQITADSTRVVYFSYQDANVQPELHRAFIDGSGEVELATSSVGAGLGDGNYALSPGGRVLFTGELDTAGIVELYSVPLDGGAPPLRLSGSLVTGGDVGRLVPTADGARVVYAADARVDGRVELFSAPIVGGATPKLLSDDVNSSSDPAFQLDPTGKRVVFRRFVPGTHLFSAPVDGTSPPTRLDGLGAPDTVLADFQILPGGERVLFKGGSSRYELYLVSIRGGRTLRLNGDLPAFGSVYSHSFGAPGFVYSANQEDPNQVELYHAVLTRHVPR